MGDPCELVIVFVLRGSLNDARRIADCGKPQLGKTTVIELLGKRGHGFELQETFAHPPDSAEE